VAGTKKFNAGAPPALRNHSHYSNGKFVLEAAQSEGYQVSFGCCFSSRMQLVFTLIVLAAHNHLLRIAPRLPGDVRDAWVSTTGISILVLDCLLYRPRCCYLSYSICEVDSIQILVTHLFSKFRIWLPLANLMTGRSNSAWRIKGTQSQNSESSSL
jgi:hypothetical protein